MIQYEKGNYAYVGSAMSSLFPRLERHYSKKKRLHWHIDYLTASRASRIKGAVYAAADTKVVECVLGSKLAELPFSKAVPRFGSTDCEYGCQSHLFKLNSTEKQAMSSIIQFYKKLGLRPLLY